MNRSEPPRGPVPDPLARERERANRASEDARRAERELLEARARIRQLEGQLGTVERRLDALRHRLAVRLVTGVSGRIGAVASAARGRTREDDRFPEPAAVVPTRSYPGIDDRDIPSRYRHTLLAALDDPTASDGPFRVLPFGRVGDLAHALAARGLEVVTKLEAGPDAIVVADPAVDPASLHVGPMRIGVHPAISDDFDLLVGSSDDPATSVVEAIERWLRATRVGIRIPPANPSSAESWGDTHLARGMRTELREAGWPTRLHLRSDWDAPVVGTDDVVLDLLGLHEATTSPGAVRVLWQISHPEMAGEELYERYDTVFVASDPFAAQMADLVRVPVVPLHQATDPERFAPTAGGPPHELLFVGGWREAGRQILDDLLPTHHDLAVYGGRWTAERTDPSHLAGGAIPNEELAAYYSAAAIVLNDHWAGMRREGFLSNRLYDASAAGAFVISDDVEGLETEFDGGIVGYRDRPHLRALIDRFLADPDGRRRYRERARTAVLARHTFAHRARRFVEVIEPLVAAARLR